MNNLVYSSLSETVETVFVDGNLVLLDGDLTNLDAVDAYKNIDASAESLCSRIGFPLPQHWPVV